MHMLSTGSKQYDRGGIALRNSFPENVELMSVAVSGGHYKK